VWRAFLFVIREELLLQGSQDVCKQLFLSWASWRCFWLRTFCFVDHANQHEHHECDDQEVDDCHDELAVCECCFTYACSQATKVYAAHEQTDQWVDQVFDKAADDCSERSTDDDTNPLRLCALLLPVARVRTFITQKINNPMSFLTTVSPLCKSTT